MNFMRKIVFSIVIFLCSISAFGQNNSGTPYSKYGLGIFPDNYGPYTAMGGVSVAMRDNYNINFMNPASYTALDTLRFYFQLGVSGEYVDISTNKEHSKYQVAQNASINMAFRLYKKLFMSFGFNEKSDIGYDILYNNEVIGDPSMRFLQHIEGEGGLNEAYLGLAYQFGKLSIGVNSSLIFGKLEERQTLQILPVGSGYYLKTRTQTNVFDALFTMGAQLPLQLNKNSNLTLGTSFNFGTNFHGKKTFEAYKISMATGAQTPINDEKWEDGNIHYPFKMIIGTTYEYKKRWLISGDYTFQNMSQYQEFGGERVYKNYHKAALGGYFQPDATGRYWWQRNKYMAGTYFTRSHIDLNDHSINTYGITVGSQIPVRLRTQELMLGVAFDFGMRGTRSDNLILEKYAKVRINIAFKEIWFMKSKIN